MTRYDSGVAGPRAIIHLDLDAFYASVEQLDDPQLRGRPVIVAGPSRRGVVCAASYEARRFGVRSAMPTARAERLCPDGVFVSPRFDRYHELSDEVFAIFRRVTPLVEPLSLDEAFLDVTGSAALHGSGDSIARSLKLRVKEETGLTVSAGVAEVKLAAKIASDLGKPDGLVVVPQGAVAAFLAPLPIGRLWGVGKVTEAALRELHCATIGDLARAPAALVASRLGRHGADLQALARGDDPREVIPDEEARSVGAEETFEEDVVGADALLARLLSQSERVAQRLREHGLAGRTVTLKVKYSDFRQVTRRVTLAAPTSDGKTIYDAARAQLARVDLDVPVRLSGVTVSGFDAPPAASRQLGLFDAPPADPRRDALNAAVDSLARRFGRGAVRPATLAGDRRDDGEHDG
ncbi:MAG TPA: DNA polymerase IV [Anaeromyxobacteraceae bacterium]|nr:DNA polymerase IV [Anaeromyxobacteraceae bacterium]